MTCANCIELNKQLVDIKTKLVPIMKMLDGLNLDSTTMKPATIPTDHQQNAVVDMDMDTVTDMSESNLTGSSLSTATQNGILSQQRQQTQHIDVSSPLTNCIGVNTGPRGGSKRRRIDEVITENKNPVDLCSFVVLPKSADSVSEKAGVEKQTMRSLHISPFNPTTDISVIAGHLKAIESTRPFTD
ncbi:uncharacterized protein LOC129571225, partial [Sitodiplosis mosellana]|uniref:uncharacterized protein LOC129571225 n=1 Tax=Sitodiplosis mosellana TaxID=263140 RepID=UPI0024444418